MFQVASDLVGSLTSCLRSWWRVDRIRSSPTEGRLLRLQPPAFLLIDGRTIEVTRRVIGQDRDGAFVSYDCLENGSAGRLMVRLAGNFNPRPIRWVGAHGERVLDERDVSVFEPAR